METFYLIIVILLFILALFDLSVGVSNDAVNFLNSAIGSKVAPFKVIVIVAAIGIFAGASMSNGMMDIARHGIFQPQHFYFSEIMLILLAVMMTDVMLLDMFNTLGMPTSTTVSLIFELVGATVAISWVKIANSDGMLNFGELVNTQKAFTVIIAIFVSVAIAFFFGAVVQYLTRLVFSFNYKKTAKYFIGFFGGLCITAIIYFVLIKGLKNASFMTNELKEMLKTNLTFILWGCFIAFSLLMQCLYWLKVNVLKIIVLLGTFSLALAFASNDLVNFIGVPLTGYSAFMDYSAHATAETFDTYLMSSLAKSASTEWYFLVIAGIVMVIALATSKKAQGVVKTSVDLARQNEGEEMFGTSPVARFLVRNATQMANFTIHITPSPLKNWINSRFNTDEMILEDKAAFDLVRASVNLVLAGLLIVIGTSMKLPLSTTYVTFMVAMGTSLADRAWGRESVVFRITGVLAVIGGWFITAGAAFTICFIVALLFYFLGIPAMIAMIAIVTFTLIRSNIMYKKRKSEELERDSAKELAAQICICEDKTEALDLIRLQSREETVKILKTVIEKIDSSIEAFNKEDLKILRKDLKKLHKTQKLMNQIKRVGTMGVSHLDFDVAMEKGLFYYQGNSFLSELVFCSSHITEICKTHIDNNFSPLSTFQKEDLQKLTIDLYKLLTSVITIIQSNKYAKGKKVIVSASTLYNKFVKLKQKELRRIQEEEGSIKTSMIYLEILQEIQNMITYTTNLLKVSHKFQMDDISSWD